ncbi:MAG: phage tail assembly chaperone [Rhodobacterales bacterium]|nr:phage tail assembly chaperone [Rhodobacterales bacterium]
MTGIDWPGLMRAGLRRSELGGLGLTPEVFWRLTPAELRLMLGAEAAVPPLTRARLDELARAFPDRRNGGEDGTRG